MTTFTSCPVCRRDAYESSTVELDDGVEVQCETCGTYLIEGTAQATIKSAPDHILTALSGDLRRASRSGDKARVTDALLQQMQEHGVRFNDLFRGLDQVLLYLGEKADRHFGKISYNPSRDYAYLGFASEEAMRDSLHAAKRLGYLDRRGERLTIEGWRQIQELRGSGSEGRQAFVAVPFEDDYDEVSRAMERGVKEAGFHPHRIDREPHNEQIDAKIQSDIRRSALLVAEVSSGNAGVYFEAGLALGFGLPVVWCCRDKPEVLKGLHFDTRQYNHVLWSDPDELARKLRYRVVMTIPGAVGP